MTDTLVVHVNRDGPYELETAVATFETDDTFDVALRNHGQASHVHLQLGDTLSTVASIDNANHFVDTEETHTVPVTVHDDRRPVRGRLKLVTGYGKETEFVSVRLVEPDESSDESRPSPDDEGPIDAERIVERASNPRSIAASIDDTAPVLLLGGVALLLAFATVAVLDGMAVMFGALVVLLGVCVALYTLFA